MNKIVNIIDLRTYHDEDLLQQVYSQLYLNCFSDPDEQENLDQYRDRLFGSQKPPPQPQTHFLVAGDDLEDPDRRAVSGFLIFELYRESRCGLLTYLAVDPAARSRGLGRLLLRRAIDTLVSDCGTSGGLKAIFAETHDPKLVDPADDAMPPDVRIRVMARLGAYYLPIHYVQPELRPGDGRSRKLLLITFSIDGSSRPVITSGVLLAFLHEFYRALGVTDPYRDPDYQKIQQDLATSAVEPHSSTFTSALPCALIR